MGKTEQTRHGRGRLAAVLVLAASALVLMAVLAPSAFAFGGWTHTSATSVRACHPGGDTGVPGTNAACQTCHTKFELRTGATQDCWSCHRPGQAWDLQVAGRRVRRVSRPDGRTCGTTTTITPHATPHYGGLKACTTLPRCGRRVQQPREQPASRRCRLHGPDVSDAAPTVTARCRRRSLRRRTRSCQRPAVPRLPRRCSTRAHPTAAKMVLAEAGDECKASGADADRVGDPEERHHGSCAPSSAGCSGRVRLTSTASATRADPGHERTPTEPSRLPSWPPRSAPTYRVIFEG